MTEAEWLAFTTQDHGFIWEAECLEPLLTERRYRLFASACCRRIWRHIPDKRSKQVIDALELLADGILAESEWGAVREAYSEADDRPNSPSQAERWALSAVATCLYEKENRLATSAARDCQSTVGADVPPGETNERKRAEEQAQCDLLRDIFGNPFRPVSFSPEWRTDTAVAIARQMYESRDFSAMPILADALQDAGCDNDDILSHCRSEDPHVRGCWVVDLVLGKE